MAHATDIVGYSVNASQFCPAHIVGHVLPVSGITAEEVLDKAAEQEGVNREDESSFDMAEFPKVIFRSQITESDTCEDCGEYLGDVATGDDLLPHQEPSDDADHGPRSHSDYLPTEED